MLNCLLINIYLNTVSVFFSDYTGAELMNCCKHVTESVGHLCKVMLTCILTLFIFKPEKE